MFRVIVTATVHTIRVNCNKNSALPGHEMQPRSCQEMQWAREGCGVVGKSGHEDCGLWWWGSDQAPHTHYHTPSSTRSQYPAHSTVLGSQHTINDRIRYDSTESHTATAHTMMKASLHSTVLEVSPHSTVLKVSPHG